MPSNRRSAIAATILFSFFIENSVYFIFFIEMKKVVIAGGTGFLGRKLTDWLKKDYTAKILTRTPESRVDGEIHWDGKSLGKWQTEIDGAHAVINLSGKSVNCRYHRGNKAEILKSRINTTRVIGEAIQAATDPPKVWINASTATIYRASRGTPRDEAKGELDTGFSASVAKAWEDNFMNSYTPDTRKVALRTSLVLGDGSNSALPILRLLSKFGLGGRIGNGEQMFSWIHETDFLRAVKFLMEEDDLAGVFNVTSPAPIDNRTFMKSLRSELGAPFGIPTPKPILAIGAFLLRTEPELTLKSRYVIPRRLMENRFQFAFPFIDEALRDLFENWRGEKRRKSKNERYPLGKVKEA